MARRRDSDLLISWNQDEFIWRGRSKPQSANTGQGNEAAQGYRIGTIGEIPPSDPRQHIDLAFESSPSMDWRRIISRGPSTLLEDELILIPRHRADLTVQAGIEPMLRKCDIIRKIA